MMKAYLISTLLVSVLAEAACLGQTNTVTSRFLKRDKPPAYQNLMSKQMLAEVNHYASRLNLPESLPITTNSVKELYISSPTVAERFGALGSLQTTNFSYGFGKGKHLCYITRVIRGDNPYSYKDNKQFAIDPTAVNTNAACQAATQMLAMAYVDLNRLSTSSVVSVKPWVILDMTTCKYTVQWSRNGRPIVKVVLVEPKKELWVLRIEDPNLIHRKPLELGNLDFPSSHTNALTFP